MIKKTLIFAFLSLFANLGFAGTQQLICLTNPEAIASQLDFAIRNQWAPSGNPNWYASWADVKMGDFYTIGGVGDFKGKPQNPNPFLSYVGVDIQGGRESGDTELDCVYEIHSTEICDANCPTGGGLFYMRAQLYNVEPAQCHRDPMNNYTVRCDE